MTNESKPSIEITLPDWKDDQFSIEETPERPVSPVNGQPVPVGPGRPKGLKNKTTQLRAAFYEAFERTGGVDNLVQWAQQSSTNYKVFLQTLTKILPKDDGHAADIAVQIVNYSSNDEQKTTITNSEDN